MQVGAEIRELRRQRGWTQADLSHFSRMSASDISKIETGRLLPSSYQLERLNRALGVADDPSEIATIGEVGG